MLTTELLGRYTELSALREFCRSGESSAASMLLRGEAGVGKTALLDAITEWAAAEGFCVLRADAVQTERGTEFSALNQLLASLEGLLPRMRTDDQQALSKVLGFAEGSSWESGDIAAAARSLMGLAAAGRPVLLIIDDVQWADRASAHALGRLIRSLEGNRTSFLGAARLLDTGFFDSDLTPCTEVPPLDPVASSQLVSRHFPDLDRRAKARLLARGRGNPMALLELPRMLGVGHRDLLHPSATPPPLTRRAQHEFAADIQALPEKTSRLLLLVALEGTGDLDFLSAPAGALGLRPAERAGLVVLNAETRRVAFRHPLVPVTVIGLATSGDRREAHQELSRLLSGWPERRAPHLAEATTGPDEGVAAQLESVAPLIARHDAAASVTIYVRSAALSENVTNKARRLVEAAHLLITSTGDLETGRELLQQATRSDPAVVSSLRYAMASSVATFHGGGDADTAHRVLVDAFGPQLAHHDVDRGTLVGATQVLLDLCLWTQRPEHRDSLRAVVSAARSGDAVEQPLLGAGKPSQRRDRLEAVVADGRDRGGTAAAIDALCRLTQDAFTTGEWDEAKVLVHEGLTWCDELGYRLHPWTLRWVSTLVDVGRGHHRAVIESTEEMLQWAERHGIGMVRDYAHHARALAALSTGEFELAYREARSVAPAGTRWPLGSVALDLAVCMVEASLHTSRVGEAAAHARDLRAYSSATSPRLRLLVAASTAMAAPRGERAPLFERALAVSGCADHPFDLARVHLAYGRHLRRSRATSMARGQLRIALEMFERLDARPWMNRTRIELEASGETRSVVERRFALTAQERTVALLAASGHTNKQIAEKLIVTPRTVAAHLRQVFVKLGVDSRAALRDALVSRGGKALHTLDSVPGERLLSQTLVDRRDDDRTCAPRRTHTAYLPS